MSLILLDEPFSALDAPLRASMRDELIRPPRVVGIPTVLVTHDPAEAMLLADGVLLLHRGRMLQAGRVAAVWAQPVDETAARILGATFAAAGRVRTDGRIDVGGGVMLRVAGPELPAGVAVKWSVRPYQVRLSPSGEHGATVLLTGPVRDGQRSVELRLGSTVLKLRVDPSCPGEGPCGVGVGPDVLQVWTAPASGPGEANGGSPPPRIPAIRTAAERSRTTREVRD